MAPKKRKFEETFIGFLDDHLPDPKRHKIDLLVVVDSWLSCGEDGDQNMDDDQSHNMEDKLADSCGSFNVDGFNFPDLDFELPEEIGSFELVGTIDESPEIDILPALFGFDNVFV